MLPHETKVRRVSKVARLQLFALRVSRERPLLCLLLTAFFALLLLLFPARCPSCDEPCATSLAAVSGAAVPIAAPAVDVATLTAAPSDAAGDATSMAHVVVGVMTARRFHRTRCQAQSATWLQRARRVVFFSDSADGAPRPL